MYRNPSQCLRVSVSLVLNLEYFIHESLLMKNCNLISAIMEHTEDTASNGPAMGEDHHSQENENPPPPPPPNRLEATMALLLENQNALMQVQLGGGVAGPSLLDNFCRLYTSEFGGPTVPADAEFWLHGLERVLAFWNFRSIRKLT